jgi:hypothetical protein
MIHVFTPIPIGTTLIKEWNKSYTFARWVMDYHDELKELYSKYKKDCRKSNDEMMLFCEFCEYYFSQERSILEPHLN